MIASLARKFNASEPLAVPAAAELHLWFCHRQMVGSSDQFLRDVLSRYAGVPPQQLRITRGQQGKPALAHPALSIAFNLSDSGEWRVMAVSNGVAIGIDLEYCDPQREVLKIARRCFSRPEIAQLEACTEFERSQRFYDYWTLKEAHVKATGGSLARELENTCFALTYPGADSVRSAPGSITADPLLPPAHAWYGLMQPIADYRLALCCLAAQDFSGGLRLFQLPGADKFCDKSLGLRAVSMTPTSTAEAACL